MGNCLTIPRGSKIIVKNELLRQANTGDIVLWSGKGIESFLVRFFAREDQWSHVGIVVKDPYTGKVFLFESNHGFDPFDELSRAYKDGVRLSDLDQKMSNYEGYYVALRKLHLPSGVRDREFFETNLWDFIREVSDKPYAQSFPGKNVFFSLRRVG